jgi:hypothetical protein
MSTAQKAADDATFMGFVGNIAGQALGPFQDPLNAATLFYPAAKVTSTMSYMQAIKAGAIAEAKAAAFPLAVNKPGEISVRRELGEDVSVGQAALETGLEIGGAALIGGAVGAAAKRFTRVIDDVSSVEAQKHPNLTEAEHAEAVNKSIQEIDAPYAKSDIPEPDVKPVDVKPPTYK